MSPPQENFGTDGDANAVAKPEKQSPSEVTIDPKAQDASVAEKEDMGNQDVVESQRRPVKYPKSVFFIVSNEFCERFTYYGIRTVLPIYLTTVLFFSEDNATVIYHAFVIVNYFTPLLGAMVADSLWGRFRTIFYVSIIYAIGNIVLSLGTIPVFRSGAITATAIGLFLIALGSGGIKPCVSSFGGDQFILPQQEKQQKQFFSVYYFAVNSGSFISTFLTPILAADLMCFGEDTCYMSAFGVPAIFMIISLTFFLLGKPMYRFKKPEGNLLIRLAKLMTHAVVQKIKSKGPKKEHWLDYASDKFEESFIEDTKGAFRVLALFVPLPVFWSLYDQQGSRWTFQAEQMNGVLGSYTIQPAQMQVINPILILAFIPLFESLVYPLFAKCNLLTSSISRIFVGGCLAAVAFGVSGLVDLRVEPSLAVIPSSGEGQLRIFNGLDKTCSVSLKMDQSNFTFDLPPRGEWREQHLKLKGNPEAELKATCGEIVEKNITLREEKALSYLIGQNGETLGVYGNYTDSVKKTSNGDAKVRVLFGGATVPSIYSFSKDDGSTNLNGDTRGTSYVELEPGEYTFYIESVNAGKITVKQGGVYAIVVSEKFADYKFDLRVITPYNDVHMLWQVPQYVIITAAEIMFSITGLEFAFTQAPASMKSLLSAAWLLTDSFGNLLIIIIVEIKIFDKQAYEFFLYAVIMLVVMFIFLWMAWGFKYVQVQEDEEDLKIKADAVITATEN